MSNSIDAFIPQLWANESLIILEDNIMAAGLVKRDFENMLQNYGDVVNTRSIGTFTSKRKTNADDVTDQDANATNVPVTLNQHVHVSFVIKDGEQSKSFKNLVAEYLTPAMIAQAKFLDQIVLGQMPQFWSQFNGTIGGVTSSTAKASILNTRNVMNINKAPTGGRQFIWTPNGETAVLNTDIFLQANTSGDGGHAMREAEIGRKLGFGHYMSQLASSVPITACDVTTGAVNNSSGYSVGQTSLVVDGFTGALANNQYISIAGDVHRIVSHTETSSNTTGIVIAAPGLRQAVVNDAVIKAFTVGAVNLVAGYAAGYAKDIAFDGVTNAPVVGQFVNFGTTAGSAVYTIIDKPTASTMVLDRPLEAALTNDMSANFGPNGEYNFALYRDAIALVVRPLALPAAGLGANSAVVNEKGLSMRATMTYDGKAQGTRVTLDMLCGIKVLNTALASVLVG